MLPHRRACSAAHQRCHQATRDATAQGRRAHTMRATAAAASASTSTARQLLSAEAVPIMKTSETAAIARIYVVCATLLAFVLIWTATSGNPFPSSAKASVSTPAATPIAAAADPRLVALARQERTFNAESLRIRRQLNARLVIYRHARTARLHQISNARQAASAPPAPIYVSSYRAPAVSTYRAPRAPAVSTRAPVTHTRPS